jgi:hypothetical protein
MDVECAKKALRTLWYYNFIAMVDVFQFSNIYVTTEKMSGWWQMVMMTMTMMMMMIIIIMMMMIMMIMMVVMVMMRLYCHGGRVPLLQ